jgi:hypothetical protein
MRLLSVSECSDWLNGRGVGFSAREYPLVEETEAIEFTIPGDAGQTIALAYLFGDLEKNTFDGGILMFREWNIGSPGLNSIGHQIVRRMLRLHENETHTEMPLPIALEASEAALMPALLLQAMIFGWDAFYVPNSGAFLLFISHDEVAFLATKESYFSEDVSIQVERLSTGTVITPYYLSRAANEVEAS